MENKKLIFCMDFDKCPDLTIRTFIDFFEGLNNTFTNCYISSCSLDHTVVYKGWDTSVSQ